MVGEDAHYTDGILVLLCSRHAVLFGLTVETRAMYRCSAIICRAGTVQADVPERGVLHWSTAAVVLHSEGRTQSPK